MEQEPSIDDLKKQRDEYLAGWQRARADLLNYKREEMDQLNAMGMYAAQIILEKLLPLVDNVEIAEKNVPEEFKANEYIKGLLRLETQLTDLLKSYGVEPIETLGKKFDPNIHEAVAMVKKEGAEAGTVLEETEKGYTIHQKLLRPAKVKVAE